MRAGDRVGACDVRLLFSFSFRGWYEKVKGWGGDPSGGALRRGAFLERPPSRCLPARWLSALPHPFPFPLPCFGCPLSVSLFMKPTSVHRARGRRGPLGKGPPCLTSHPARCQKIRRAVYGALSSLIPFSLPYK